MTARAPVAQRQLKKPGLLARVFRGLSQLISLLFVALVFSILLEWIGMTIGWPEEGVRHSERMLAQELRYLNQDFKQSFFHARPAELARAAATSVQRAAEEIGLTRFIAWLNTRAVSETGARSLALDLFSGSRGYLEAMLNVVQTFSVRITVLALATPVFGLFGLVGLAEGLMRRDLRRWGGGRESSFIYHHSKHVLVPSIVAAWMIYLAAPFSVHPNVVLLPFAVVFAIGVAVTATTFKKYL